MWLWWKKAYCTIKLTTPSKQRYRYSQKHLFLTYRINCWNRVSGLETTDTWTCFLGHETEDYRQRNYKIWETKTRHTITRMKIHVMATPISAEYYLWNELLKTDRRWRDDTLNEFINCFTQMHNHECLDEMEMEGKDTVPRTIQHQSTWRQSSLSNKTKQ